MVDRYWIPNSAGTASTAANWSTVADGSGSTGVPSAGDSVFFGDETTLGASKGNGQCEWDITPTLDVMTVNEGYRSISTTGEGISFTAPSTITNDDEDWATLGFRAGMKITVTGSTSNNATYDIASVSDDTITVVQTTLVDEAAGASVTVAYETFIEINASFGLNMLSLNGELKNTTGTNYTISFSGTHNASSDKRYILNKEYCVISNGGDLEYDIDGSANGSVATYFDDGYYPKITCSGGVFSFGHKTPSYSGFESASMYGMTVTAGASITVDATATPQNNQSRYFVIENATQFSSLAEFDAGKSTWEFQLDVGSYALPISNATDTFRWYNLIITSDTAGRKATIASNRTLSVNSLVVGVDAVLEGSKTRGDPTSVIISVRRPKILGAWNFSQLSDGIYASLMETALPITPADGGSGRVQLSNGAGAFTSDQDLTFDSTLNNLKTVGVQFDTANLVDVASEGEMRWDENAQTIAVGAVNAVHAHLGQTFQYNVKNQTGSTLSAGTVVQAAGSLGASGRILIEAMDASGTGKAKLILGILQEDVPTGGDSVALALGKIRNLDLTSLKPVSETWADGDVLYCDQSNAGGLTNVAPSSGIILAVAFVVYYNANGTIAVRALPVDEGATGGGSGTVTSVDMSVPTGFAISGNPITGSGTLALAFDTGYALPTSAKQTQWDTAYGWGDHSTQGYLTSTPPETDPIFAVSEAALLSSGDAAKLAGIEPNAQVNIPLQHMRLYGINTGSNLHTVTSGSRVYLDLGDGTKFAESTTGSHPDITVTNAATDYITIAAGGIYQITGHVGIFPASYPATHDVWVEYNTNTSANRELGVSRMQHASNSTGNMNYKHSTVVEVPSTGSDMNIYISVFSNGATANVRAYDNNRFFFTITRIGDSTV